MVQHDVLPGATDVAFLSGRARSALNLVLNTVFGESWVGQQRFTTTAEIDALHAALHVGADGHVLDLGSGLGGPTIHLAQQFGCEVTGIDPSAEHVRYAQSAAAAAGVGGRVRFIPGSALAADFPPNSFDAIVSRDTFVTIPDKARLFTCCRNWLRPHGRLAATLIVDLHGPQHILGRPTPLLWAIPTADSYRILAELAGLRVLAIDDLTPSFREISARWRGALMVWEVELGQSLGYNDWMALRSTVGQLAEWATQGLIGHIRFVAVRER